MNKPIKPIEPSVRDKNKYPDLESNTGKNYLGNEIRLPHPQWLKDYEKYIKALLQYETDVILYEQLKYIRFIKVANEKLILKKYKITKL